jgi:hypothetical protein
MPLLTSTMTAGQQFLTDSAERSMIFCMKIGEMALQGFEHLMSEYVRFRHLC